MSPADKILLYFPSVKIFRSFLPKEEYLLPLFHKMLKGLRHISMKTLYTDCDRIVDYDSSMN